MFDRMKEDIASVFHRDPAARNTLEVPEQIKPRR